MRVRVERFIEPVLLLAALESPFHGYDLPRLLEKWGLSVSAIDLGNLYRVLRFLETEGLLRSSWEEVGGRGRRVYRPTPAGRALLHLWTEGLREHLKQVQTFLQRIEAALAATAARAVDGPKGVNLEEGR